MERLAEHSDSIAKIASGISYSTAGVLVIDDWLQFLNNNGVACSILLGFATLLVNVFFQCLNYRRTSACERKSESDDGR